MKKVYLTINYKTKVQVLEGGNADELLDGVFLEVADPEIYMVDHTLDDANVLVDAENPDFFTVDARFKAVLEYDDGDLEDIVENGIDFGVDGPFVVWDWEIYGWGIEDAK